jgi:transcriptional regulator with XRE-family HTH domain
VNIQERDAFYDDLVASVAREQLTWGQAVRLLRTEVAGVTQANFAKMCKISVRTLRNLETDAGNPTIETLEATLRPFGLKLTISRKS